MPSDEPFEAVLDNLREASKRVPSGEPFGTLGFVLFGSLGGGCQRKPTEALYPRRVPRGEPFGILGCSCVCVCLEFLGEKACPVAGQVGVAFSNTAKSEAKCPEKGATWSAFWHPCRFAAQARAFRPQLCSKRPLVQKGSFFHDPYVFRPAEAAELPKLDLRTIELPEFNK